MNWLAHLFLSEPSPAFRIGSILPDFAPQSALCDLAGDFRRGIEMHHSIDAFTDAHPIFRRSVNRFVPPFRRYGGILADVFYDHFLSLDWDSYCETRLERFAAEFDEAVEGERHKIPEIARQRLVGMCAEKWLCSYREISGVAAALSRISARLRRPFDLSSAVSFLERDYDGFHSDFAAFMPEVMARVGKSHRVRDQGAAGRTA